MLIPYANCNANANRSLNLTPREKVWKVMKKVKIEKGSQEGESQTKKQWHTRLEA